MLNLDSMVAVGLIVSLATLMLTLKNGKKLDMQSDLVQQAVQANADLKTHITNLVTVVQAQTKQIQDFIKNPPSGGLSDDDKAGLQSILDSTKAADDQLDAAVAAANAPAPTVDPNAGTTTGTTGTTTTGQ